ncbi:hypothetical protein EPO17_01525 [Patescibacteria group bacterium]|nr:MAG: hypothetical protein EPO17_01525 [Patescibacteria group bacterium]
MRCFFVCVRKNCWGAVLCWTRSLAEYFFDLVLKQRKSPATGTETVSFEKCNHGPTRFFVCRFRAQYCERRIQPGASRIFFLYAIVILIMKKNYCYLNGKILPVQDAKISVYDIGLLRGYGIYEGITTYNGKPFRLNDHLTRFRSSAKALDLSIPFSDVEIEQAILALLDKNGFDRTNLRMIMTGGDTISGIEYDTSKPTLYILAEKYTPLPSELYTSGASLITHEHQRALPEYKTINYITAVQVQKERKAKGSIEVLFVSNGQVLEAATSNIFIVKDGVVITPKRNMLLGITRKVAIELAQKKYTVIEREVTTAELFSADEVFLTASYKEIVPIVSIDDKKIAGGKVGKVTQVLMRDFQEYTEKGIW